MDSSRWSVFLGAIFFLGVACSKPLVPIPPLVQQGQVEFRVIFPRATTVAIAGDFNEWSSTKHLCERLGRGEWKISVPLSSGEYHFMYIVDGQEWVTPPLADDFVSDGFGQENGVIYVP